ncbi:9285_t:CDS:1, partial [Scutellospora calospora]
APELTKDIEIEETRDLQSEISLPLELSSQKSDLTKHVMHKPTADKEHIIKKLKEYKDSTILLSKVLDKLVENCYHILIIGHKNKFGIDGIPDIEDIYKVI